MRMTKRVMLLAATPTLVLMIAPVFIAPSYAATGPTFSATATAAGVDAVITNDSLPLGINPEFAGPSTQASLTSLGDSDAQAAFPDLGATVNGVPGLAGALVGGLPVPAYPLVVASNTTRPHADTGAPGIELSAESQVSSSAGRAVVGTLGNGFTTTSEVALQSDSSVLAQSSTTLGINLLNLVSISGVQSSATVRADAFTGQLTRTSSMSIGQISIAGLSVTLPPGTPNTIPIPIPIPGLPQLPPLTLPVLPIPLGGTTLPIPDLGFENGTFTVTLPLLGNAIKFAIPAGPVLSALKALGINVTYQTAQQTTTGIIAPALTFNFTAPALPQNNYFNGPTGISFTLGRSAASVTLHPVLGAGGSASGGTGLPVGGSTGGGIGGIGSGTGTTPPVGGVGGALPSLGGSIPSVVPGGTSSSGVPNASGSGGGTTTPRLNPVALVDTSQADLSGVYLVAVAVAGVALAAASILRLLGVRLLWGS
jgi:hypothetical protein